MKSIVAAIAALAVAAVSAQTTPPVSVTSPLTGTVYTAGGQALITWINPTVTTLAQIQLAKGPSNALQPVGLVASNVATASGTYTWTIPANTAPGTDYAFELGVSPNIAFTGFFTIQAATGGAASNSSAAASGSAASSSAPASTSGAASTSAPAATSAAATSAAASSAAGSSAAASSPAAASTSAKSGANAVKAGVVGAGLVAGAAVLLF